MEGKTSTVHRTSGLLLTLAIANENTGNFIVFSCEPILAVVYKKGDKQLSSTNDGELRDISWLSGWK